MKVLHVLEYSLPLLAGYTIRSKYIIDNQKKQNLKPVVITSPIMKPDTNQPGQYDMIDGVKYYRTGIYNRLSDKDNIASRLYKRYQYSRRYLYAIIEVAQKEKPDIIHAHSSYLNGIRAAQAGKKLGIPSFFEVRGLWGDTAVAVGDIAAKSWKYKFVSQMEIRAMRKATGVIVIANSLKDHLKSKKYLNKKIWVVPNGVDVEKFFPQKKNEELIDKYQLENKTVLGFIGSISAIEGLHLVIEAFAKLDKEHDIVFMLVGDGNDLSRLKKMINTHQLDDRFIVVGRVPHNEVKDYYSVMDALVYPRIDADVNNRVTPLKPLEAMAMGKLVIASDVEGLKELVIDRVNGFLFKRNNSEDLSYKIQDIALDKINCTEEGDKARDWVCGNRQWALNVKKYHQIYQSVLE